VWNILKAISLRFCFTRQIFFGHLHTESSSLPRHVDQMQSREIVISRRHHHHSIIPVSEMTYTVSSGTLNSILYHTIPYHTILLYPYPIGWEHYAMMTVVWPSVSLSQVWSWVENGSAWQAVNWQDRSLWHGWPVTSFRGRKVKDQGHQAD